MGKKGSAEDTVKAIRRKTRRKYNAEEKIRIVIEGIRGEDTVAELCRREGIAQSLCYKWSKEFLEAALIDKATTCIPEFVIATLPTDSDKARLIEIHGEDGPIASPAIAKYSQTIPHFSVKVRDCLLKYPLPACFPSPPVGNGMLAIL